MTLQIRHCEEAFSADEAIFFAIIYFQLFIAKQERLLHSTTQSLTSVRNDATNSSLRGDLFSRRSNLFCYFYFKLFLPAGKIASLHRTFPFFSSQ